MRPAQLILSLATVLALTVSAAAVVSAAGGRPYTVPMMGAQEAPGPGDADGTGTAWLRVNPGQAEVCYVLDVEDIATATAAHIHRAPAGSPGGVVVGLTAPSSGSSAGCAAVSRELALELIRTPEAFYVNVHNAEFPGGAVRGQLSK